MLRNPPPRWQKTSDALTIGDRSSIALVQSEEPELIDICSIELAQDPVPAASAPALREVIVPIRSINGDMNPTNLEVNRKYAPQFDVVIMKGGGHSPMLEQPARFNELLADFIRSLRAQSK